MSQTLVNIIKTSLFFGFVIGCLWLFRTVGVVLAANIVIIYLLLLVLQIQIVGILGKINTSTVTPDTPKPENLVKPKEASIYDGSLLDSVNVIDVNSIEFSTEPLSFQQQQMYVMIKTGEAQSRADGYVLILGFLHVRALDKSIAFRNLPIDVIPQLVEKAYRAAEQKSQIIEFENDIFTDETT